MVLPSCGDGASSVSGERGSVAKRSRRGVADQDRCGDRAAAVLGEQLRRVSLDQRVQLARSSSSWRVSR